jgi:hypothetical protein
MQIRSKIYILWTLVFLIASVLLSNSDYQSSSNDSKYYSTLVARYQDKSWPEVFSAKWGENYWGFDQNSYMRDQLPGQVAMGVALAKTGVPAKHSLHIIEMAFLLGSFFMILKIANIFIRSEESSFLIYSLMILSLSFSYNIRANHESGIFFFSTLALYSGLRLSSKWIYSIFSILSCLALMWIKGPFFIFGFILTSVGFIFSPAKKNYVTILSTLLISALAVFGSGFLYEKAFHLWTGEPFFSEFYRIQIQERAMGIAKHSFFIQKLLNFTYYFEHYVGYSMPWAVIAIILIFKADKKILKDFILSPLSLTIAFAALAYLGAFSMSERTAGRYVFPGYYFFSVWLMLLTYTQSEKFKKFHAKLGELRAHYLGAALWFIAFAAHLIIK